MVAIGVLVPSTVAGQPWTWPAIRAWVKEAEALGFDAAWVTDPMGTDVPLEAWTLAGALAAATTRIRLGVRTSLARNPAIVAKLSASLDVLSDGRCELALDGEGEGGGGGDRDASRRTEWLEVARLLWTEPEATFEGRWYRVAGAHCEPKPWRGGALPVYSGLSLVEVADGDVVGLARAAGHGPAALVVVCPDAPGLGTMRRVGALLPAVR